MLRPFRKVIVSNPLRIATTIFVSVVSVAASTVGAAPPAPAIRVMSFNVRYSAAQDGDNAWPRRVDLLFATIARFGPDLLGFQEVLADQHDAIVARLPDYDFVGVARNDGKRSGEWALVGFRKSRFTTVAHGSFWLSETPDVPGSKSWDAGQTRICTWVRLRDRATGNDRRLLFRLPVGDVSRRPTGRLIWTRGRVSTAGRPPGRTSRGEGEDRTPL